MRNAGFIRACRSTWMSWAALCVPSVAAAAVPVAAEIHVPNAERSPAASTVALDDGTVKLAGDRTRLIGVLTLSDGSTRRFDIVDSLAGEMLLDPSGNNAYPVEHPYHDQLSAYYHAKLFYEHVNAAGYAATHLPANLVIDVHADHTNAYYMADEGRVSMGYHVGRDGVRRWYSSDGEVTVHELAHAMVDTVAPGIESFEGAMIHEGIADYFAFRLSGDTCIGEYASSMHDELNKAPEAWLCSRTLDAGKAHIPTATRHRKFLQTPGRRGEMMIHANSWIISTGIYTAFQRTPGATLEEVTAIDRVVLESLMLIPVDRSGPASSEAPLRPRLLDWGTAAYAAGMVLAEVTEGHNLQADMGRLGLDDARDSETRLTAHAINRHQPWIGFAGYLATPKGQELLSSDDGYAWQAFLAAPSGASWLGSIQNLVGPTIGSEQTYLDWAYEQQLDMIYHPSRAWHDWLNNESGQAWVAAEIEPTWRALLEHVWRAFLMSDAWRAAMDDAARAYLMSAEAGATMAGLDTALSEAIVNLVSDASAESTYLTTEEMEAILEVAWLAFKTEALTRTGPEWRAWRAFARSELGWRAFGELGHWRAYIIDGWRAFMEDGGEAALQTAQWRAFTSEAWRAYSGQGASAPPTRHPETTIPKFRLYEENVGSDTHETWVYRRIDVPSGAQELRINTGGGTGDADLRVRFDAYPTGPLFDCLGGSWTNDESCVIPTPEPGPWYVGLFPYGSERFTGVTLEAVAVLGETIPPRHSGRDRRLESLGRAGRMALLHGGRTRRRHVAHGQHERRVR